MANAGPNTNGSQFFMIHADYPLPKNYTIFGKIPDGDTESLKTLGAIAETPVAAGNGGGEQAEEKTSFNVVLTAVGGQKIEVIKVVRDATGKGLKEAKDLVDATATGPQVVKEGASKEESAELKKKFDAAGATIELK